MAPLIGLRIYAKDQAVELGRVLRSGDRKKHLKKWIAHVRTDAIKQLPGEWQRFLKNPRKDVRRFWLKKTLGIQPKKTTRSARSEK